VKNFDSLETQLEKQSEQLLQMDAALGELQSSAAATALFGGPLGEPTLCSPKKSDTAEDENDRLDDLETRLQLLKDELHCKLGEVREELAKPVSRQEEHRMPWQEPEAEAAPAQIGTNGDTKQAVTAATGPVHRPPRSNDASLELMLNAGLTEVRARMDNMQDLVDEQVLTQLRQVSQQLPEANGRLERLGRQCAECLCKTEEHAVRLDLARTSLDTQDQRLQTLSERVERILSTKSRDESPLAKDPPKGKLTDEPSAQQPQRSPSPPAVTAPSLSTVEAERSQPPVTNAGQSGPGEVAKTAQKLEDICAKLRIQSIEKVPTPTALWMARDGIPGPAKPLVTPPQVSPETSPTPSPRTAGAEKPAEPKEETGSGRRAYSVSRQEALEAACVGSDEPFMPLSPEDSETDFTGC